eukprot:scaffold59538_cov61-Phaeocystis_antarctica.AAC.10
MPSTPSVRCLPRHSVWEAQQSRSSLLSRVPEVVRRSNTPVLAAAALQGHTERQGAVAVAAAVLCLRLHPFPYPYPKP